MHSLRQCQRRVLATRTTLRARKMCCSQHAGDPCHTCAALEAAFACRKPSSRPRPSSAAGRASMPGAHRRAAIATRENSADETPAVPMLLTLSVCIGPSRLTRSGTRARHSCNRPKSAPVGRRRCGRAVFNGRTVASAEVRARVCKRAGMPVKIRLWVVARADVGAGAGSRRQRGCG